MKVTKPSWLNHEGTSIFSCDFHPDGTKFVTSGQGKQGGLIIIWRIRELFEAVYSSSFLEREDAKVAELDDHVGCVNCVKFSPNGSFMASGGDDNIVIIWKISRTKTVFSAPEVTDSFQESWRAGHMLHGHLADIFDLRWSHSGEYLASCSVDSSVLVWSGKNFGEVVAQLRGHSNFVKGVCWDPLEEFIASQSDDNTLLIWPISDIHSNMNKKRVSLSVNHAVRKPFKHCTPITQFLRLDWSPDGQFIVGAHALNNEGPVAQIIDRGSWLTQRDLVGHRQPVTVVKFSPIIYSKEGESRIMLAVGSKDCSISIWLFPKSRAIFVIKDIFKNSVMDLSWSKNGKNLAAVSWDGTVAFISLEDNDEIGEEKLCDQNIADSYKKICQTDDIIDDIEFYKSHLKSKNTVESSIEPQYKPIKRNAPQIKDDSFEEQPSKIQKNTDIETIDKQIETKTKDGKRRIQPILMAKVIDDNDIETFFEAKKEKNSQPILSVPIANNESTPLQIMSKKKQAQEPSERLKIKELNYKNIKIEDNINEGEFLDNQQILDAPHIQSSIDVTLTYRDSNISIKVNNNSFCEDPKLYQLTININSLHEWEVVVSSPVTILSYSISFFCFSTNQNKIYCYSFDGNKLLPTLILRHKVSILKSHGDSYILAITIYGLLSVWNVKDAKIVVDEVDIEHLIVDQNIDSVSMNDRGMPILICQDKYSFVYNLNLKTWLPVVSEESLVQIKNTSDNAENDLNFFKLKNLVDKNISNTRFVQRMTPYHKNICNSSFCEDALYSSLYIGSTEEFIILLRIYLRNLCRMNKKSKIRSLFEFILRQENESLIINKQLIKPIERQELINLFLNILCETPKMQSLYSELKKLYCY